MDTQDHWPECETCTRTFRTQAACNQHMNAVDHWAPLFECESCFRKFRSQHAANQHMNSRGHWAPKFECKTCEKMFHSQQAAEQHMSALGHYRNYCRACERNFPNENNLRMHLNSEVHRGSNIPCPFCKVNFTTASGLSRHLETGSCSRAPMLNRETILHKIRERDPNRLITTKLLEGPNEERVSYSVNDLANNGSYWECYICHNGFTTAKGLTSHLDSDFHKEKAYRCPNAMNRCGKQFVTLAGLFNHLESESCAFMRFERVQEHVGDVIQGRRLIAFG
ncbi:hypothetical protein M501DRAFT_942443 [Patellaria atrata CBS 101060]|uniref:C2H2-type domain-containing protein n=1 Tax=Patellaria atrata CBS 101060 TaxID=1346257 RepID=A0A9P4S2N9_9PEZI|nr:hypothetical protein M501DRAFT_942443 [Patellaria atrata CBS 101060]